MKKDVVYLVALILVLVGALNWGFWGLFNFDLVAKVFGEGSTLAKVVYDLVGLSALYVAYKEFVANK
jgi:uncharacterized membrane protein YuzA (DUF378 family)